jgi:alkylation response protein AidB-like acyl-CoA dehydrogenase
MSDAATVTEEDRAESIRMIRESAAAVAPPGHDRKRIRGLRFTEPGYDREVWQEMGALGWIGLHIAEEAGGAGLGMSEFCALAEELGAGLVPEPLVAGALSARLLAAAGAADKLEALLSGSSLVLTAWQEGTGGLTVFGTPGAPRRFLPMAGGADAFLVPVAEAGKIALYWQDAAGADLTLEKTQDGGFYGTLRPAGGVKIADDIGAVLAEALDEAALATAASLLGIMDRAFAITLDYLKTRQQFGRAIGSFQVLQHRAADLKIQIALTRASLQDAALTLDTPGERAAIKRSVVSRAKSRAGDAAMLVTRQAIQLHGGIGYTDEADIGLYLRKAMVLTNQYGTPAAHRKRFAAEAPEDEA